MSEFILYYHGNDWDGVPARQRYLMSAMSRYAPVVYLDQGRDQRGRVSAYRVGDRVTVVRGLVSAVYAMMRYKLGFAVRTYVRWQLRAYRRELGRVVLWSAETWLRPHRFVPHDLFVYDCIDPCFSDDAEVRVAHELREAEVIRRADVVFASADALADVCRQYRKDVTLLNNASEPADYTDAVVSAAARPGWWPEGGGPIAAYLGSVDARFDGAYAHIAAELNPGVRFIFAGHISPDGMDVVQKLKRLPNVFFPGVVSVEDGRYLLAQCNVGLIVFKPGPMNDSINPVKLYAYALLGKPVVGTHVRELVSRPNVVSVGSTPLEFAAAIKHTLESNNSSLVADRMRFALENTWDIRAKVAWSVIEAKLARN